MIWLMNFCLFSKICHIYASKVFSVTYRNIFTLSFWFPCLKIRPSCCSRSDGFHGQSRWWRAMSLSCTLVPAPSFGVEPIRILTCPARTFANKSAFFVSVLYSWINAISSFGIPLATNLFRTSSYTLKVPSPFGVDKSQKISCVVRSAFPSSHTWKAFSTQVLTLLFSASGRSSFNSLWSNAHFLPSLVILSMLSTVGFTRPALTSSARSEKALTISCCSSLGFKTSLINSASGTGRFSISDVWISATSLKMEISSGRLKKRANRVFAR